MSLKVNTEMSTQNGEMLHRDTPACSFMILPYNRANVKGCCVQQALLANELSSELHIDYLPCWEEKTTPQSLKTKAKQKPTNKPTKKDTDPISKSPAIVCNRLSIWKVVT